MGVSNGNFFSIGAVCVGIGITAVQMTAAIMPGVAFFAVGSYLCITYFFSKSKFDILFRNLKLGIGESYPILKGKHKKEGYTLYEFTLPAGLCVQDFVDKQVEIEQCIGAGVQIDYGFKNLLIKVYSAENNFYAYEPIKTKGALEILIGYDRAGQIVTADLSDGEPHMYVAGETGSGKSTALRAILVNLILHNDVELYLGDLKNGVEFNLFRNCSKVIQFAKSKSEIEKMLQEVSAEVDRRYSLLASADVEDIRQFNKISEDKLKYRLLVIDEFADLMNEKTTILLLENLAAKARACGIHLLLSTQRPDAKVLSGRIKANVSNVLGLKTLDKVNSGIIIGHNGLEALRGKGHGIFKRGSDEVCIQCPCLSTEDAKKLIAPYNVKKQKQPPKQIKSFDFLDSL